MKKYQYFMLMGFFALSYGATKPSVSVQEGAQQEVQPEVQQVQQQINNNTGLEAPNTEAPNTEEKKQEQVANNQVEQVAQAPAQSQEQGANNQVEQVAQAPVQSQEQGANSNEEQVVKNSGEEQSEQSVGGTDSSVLTKTNEWMGKVKPGDNNTILRGIVYTVLNAGWSIEKIENGVVYIKTPDGIPLVVNSKEIHETRKMLRENGLLSPLSLPRVSQDESSSLDEPASPPIQTPQETTLLQVANDIPQKGEETQEKGEETQVAVEPNVLSEQNITDNKEQTPVPVGADDQVEQTVKTGIVTNEKPVGVDQVTEKTVGTGTVGTGIVTNENSADSSTPVQPTNS